MVQIREHGSTAPRKGTSCQEYRPYILEKWHWHDVKILFIGSFHLILVGTSQKFCSCSCIDNKLMLAKVTINHKRILMEAVIS